METESKKVVPGVGGGGGTNRERLVKGHKLSVIKWIRSGDLMYNLVTTVDNTALYNRNLLRKQTLNVFAKKERKMNMWNMWGDGCMN